jgi:hypothetical protein
MTSFWREIFRRLVGSEIDASVALFKIESAIVYLNFIKGTRSLAKLLCMLVVSVIVLACGFLLIPVALCLFMPWNPQTKAIVAAAFGAAYLILPLITMIVLFSEKRWMRVSRADKLVKEAFKQ